MTTPDPNGAARRRAIVRTAWVFLVFAGLVALGMTMAHLRMQRLHPLHSPELIRLRDQHRDETDAAIRTPLAGRIRALDLELRRRERHHHRFMRQGVWMLAGALALGLSGLRSAFPVRVTPPEPGQTEDPNRSAQTARRAVAATGAALAFTAAAVALWHRNLPALFDPAGPEPSAQSAFGDPTAPSAFGRPAAPSAFGDPATPSAFGDPSTPSAFGRPAAQPATPPEPAPPVETANGCPCRQPENGRPPPAADPSPWPRFRGPAGRGVSEHRNVPTHWDGPSGANIHWKAEVPLPGKNSPIRWGRHLFLTGADAQRREVFCFDTDNGALMWRRTVPGDTPSPTVMEDTGYAASTAATDGVHVHAIFANGDLAAFDFDGNLAWHRSLGAPVNPYGHASSLEIWDGLLLVQFDQGYAPGDGLSTLYALDAASGETVWTAARPVQASWSTPAVFEMTGGQARLFTLAAPLIIAYHPTDGRELWRVDLLRGDVAPSPVHAGDRLFVAQEYAVAAAIDTSDPPSDETRVRWEYDAGLPDIVSPLTDGERLYLVQTYGLVTCLDAATGEPLWEHDFETEFSASPTQVGALIHLTDRQGITHFFENASEFRPAGRAVLGEPVETVPAFGDGRLFIRGQRNLFAIGP